MSIAAEATRTRETPDTVERWDAIVIGAGLSGMYQLLKLRQMGFKVRVYEAGGGVGGTWYWNRYPGARFDSESWTYGFSFSPEVLKEWDWKEHFSGQPENLRYCEFLADKFDLRRDITFNARVKAAHWDDAANEWEVTFEDGGRARARFLITAIGPLSSPTMPTIPGIDDFKGESWHTGLWPHHPVSFEGKRVAVIGTGASGVQAITEIAKTVGHLTVFQRTPNWCTPLRNSADRARDHGRHPRALRRDLRPVPRELGLLRPYRRPAPFDRRDAGGARGLLREALRHAGLRLLAGQFPRRADGPGGQRRA